MLCSTSCNKNVSDLQYMGFIFPLTKFFSSHRMNPRYVEISAEIYPFVLPLSYKSVTARVDILAPGKPALVVVEIAADLVVRGCAAGARKEVG